MASRRIEDLDPRIHDRVKAIVRAWADAGMDILITCTFRSNEEQDKLYAQGRTAPGFKVTNAKAGQSLHNKGLAIDFVPVVNGKPQWDELGAFRMAADVARKADPTVSWGGSWKNPDRPHLEWQLQSGEQWATGAAPSASEPKA